MSPQSPALSDSPDLSDSQPSSAGKARRLPSSAERRANHNAIERARRETLNGRFLDLAAALPSISHIKRPSKSIIVNKSIEYVQETQAKMGALISDNAKLRQEVDELRSRIGLPPLPPPAFNSFCNVPTMPNNVPNASLPFGLFNPMFPQMTPQVGTPFANFHPQLQPQPQPQQQHQQQQQQQNNNSSNQNNNNANNNGSQAQQSPQNASQQPQQQQQQQQASLAAAAAAAAAAAQHQQQQESVPVFQSPASVSPKDMKTPVLRSNMFENKDDKEGSENNSFSGGTPGLDPTVKGEDASTPSTSSEPQERKNSNNNNNNNLLNDVMNSAQWTNMPLPIPNPNDSTNNPSVSSAATTTTSASTNAVNSNSSKNNNNNNNAAQNASANAAAVAAAAAAATAASNAGSFNTSAFLNMGTTSTMTPGIATTNFSSPHMLSPEYLALIQQQQQQQLAILAAQAQATGQWSAFMSATSGAQNYGAQLAPATAAGGNDIQMIGMQTSQGSVPPIKSSTGNNGNNGWEVLA